MSNYDYFLIKFFEKLLRLEKDRKSSEFSKSDNTCFDENSIKNLINHLIIDKHAKLTR